MLKNVVITGVSSFVGCHLANGFVGAGWRVIAILSQPKEQYKDIRKKRLKYLNKAIDLVVLDLRDETKVRAFISSNDIDLWIQHAGYSKNYTSFAYDLSKAHSINVEPLFYIYNQLSEKQTGVIITGSSMEYSNNDKGCLETDLCLPATPYGRSKLDETKTALDLAKYYKIPTRIARLFIPFGVLDADLKLINSVITNLYNRKEVQMTACLQKKDFLYVDDLVEAYLKLADDLKKGGAEILNVCGGEPVQLRSFVEIIADKINVSKDLLKFDKFPMREGEQMISYGVNDKAKTSLNWEPRLLQQGISDFLQTFYKLKKKG